MERAALKSLELVLMALVIFHEARGEPSKAREAVAHVVMNRVADQRMKHDDTVCRAILRPLQFSSFNESRQGGLSLGEGMRRPCMEWRAWHDAMNTAMNVIAGRYPDPTAEIGGANHFHDDSIDPPTWAGTVPDEQKMKIGRIWFYRL
jgi:spore germination cell wall hydrolase CwlJ-like protein